MTKRLLTLSAVFLSLMIGSFATRSVRAADDPSPEVKAFKEARNTKDPQKKIDALEKFLKDFPYSNSASDVQEMILDTLIKNWPDHKDQISAQAEKVIQAAPFWDATSVYRDVANKLVDAGIMADKAEDLALRGLAAESEETLQNARKSQASWLAVLGRAYLHNGKMELAEKTLKQAYELDPTQAAPGHALAEMAEKRGDFEKALHFEVGAFLTNISSEDARPRTKLEEYYRKVHGSLDGLDAMLDAEYEKASPAPFAAEPYTPGQGRTDKVVLAELFTGAGCPPCVSADLAFDGLAERYSHKDLAILIYHLHIPRPDPMTNPSTETRHDYYGGGGTPTFIIDGNRDMGGGPRQMANSFYRRLASEVDAELVRPAEANITLEARLEGAHVIVNAGVDKLKLDSKDLKLQIALVEEKLRYSGENGIRFHNMVVRGMGGEKEAGFALKAGQTAHLKQDFDLTALSSELKKSLDDYEAAGHRGETFKFSEKKYVIDSSDLSVVAFVQDGANKHVLQAAYVRIRPANGSEAK